MHYIHKCERDESFPHTEVNMSYRSEAFKYPEEILNLVSMRKILEKRQKKTDIINTKIEVEKLMK